MKAILVLLCAFIVSVPPAKSQVETINVLIGASESKVISYMDSLNNLKHNSFYKIDRSVTKDGSLTLSTHYTIADQDFYKCLNLVFVFKRINGAEFCTQQVLTGYPGYAESNLNYVKDNFTLIAPNTWEKQVPKQGYVVQAAFALAEGKNEKYYYLNYYAQAKN